MSVSVLPPYDAADPTLRPTWCVVDLGRLRANFAAIRAAVAPAKTMLVLKANAYGHGIETVARALAPEADYVGVAVLEEGVCLREMGIMAPILVTGGVWTKQIPIFLEHNLTLTVPSIEKLGEIEETAAAVGKVARIHLKIDTGMERIGIHHYNAAKLQEAALRAKHVFVEGIYSHFANADSPDLSDAQRQLDRLLEVVRFYERRSLPTPSLRHIANSSATLRLPESHLDLVRPGILSYGVYPFPSAPRTIEVRPAMEWRSRVIYFKVIEAGSPVGYGSTWKSDHPVRIVTIPVGYGDGYLRSASNRAEVLIRGKRYPQVGRICMDQMMVDIEWDSAYHGDEVTLVGESGGDVITAANLAEWAGTIPYEILTNIGPRVPRVYVGE